MPLCYKTFLRNKGTTSLMPLPLKRNCLHDVHFTTTAKNKTLKWLQAQNNLENAEISGILAYISQDMRKCRSYINGDDI